MRLSLAPIPYYWDGDRVRAFYAEVADLPVDVVYLGETVCGKRRALSPEDWLALADDLAAAGKEVVLSTLWLLEAESELGVLRRVAANGRYPVEANDVAVFQAEGSTPRVIGPHVNVYNPHTLACLAQAGARRWVVPPELDGGTLAEILAQRPPGMEVEVLVFGRLPLAVSARCFLARAEGRNKDDCGFACLDHPGGCLLRTQAGEPFLTVNGVQLLSAETAVLVPVVEELRALGVDLLRVVPEPAGTAQVVAVLRRLLDGELAPEAALAALAPHLPQGRCEGYWYGRAGRARSVAPPSRR